MACLTTEHTVALALVKTAKENGATNLFEKLHHLTRANLETAHKHNQKCVERQIRSQKYNEKTKSSKKTIIKKNFASKKRLEASLDEKTLKNKKKKEAGQRVHGRFEKKWSKTIWAMHPVEGHKYQMVEKSVQFSKVYDSIWIPNCLKKLYTGWKRIDTNGNSRCNGENTEASVMKMTNAMIVYLGLDRNSVFCDAGSGNSDVILRVSQFPGTKLALGIEVDRQMYDQGVTNLRNATRNSLHAPTNEETGLDNVTVPMCLIVKHDIMNLSTFAPVTHLFSFDKTFTAKEMLWLACVWNNSLGTKGYVTTKTEEKMRGYGFENIKLVATVSMKMKSSGQSHNHYMYKRTGNILPYDNECDPILKAVWKTFNDGNEAIVEHNLLEPHV